MEEIEGKFEGQEKERNLSRSREQRESKKLRNVKERQIEGEHEQEKKIKQREKWSEKGSNLV